MAQKTKWRRKQDDGENKKEEKERWRRKTRSDITRRWEKRDGGEKKK